MDTNKVTEQIQGLIGQNSERSAEIDRLAKLKLEAENKMETLKNQIIFTNGQVDALRSVLPSEEAPTAPEALPESTIKEKDESED